MDGTKGFHSSARVGAGARVNLAPWTWITISPRSSKRLTTRSSAAIATAASRHGIGRRASARIRSRRDHRSRHLRAVPARRTARGSGGARADLERREHALLRQNHGPQRWPAHRFVGGDVTDPRRRGRRDWRVEDLPRSQRQEKRQRSPLCTWPRSSPHQTTSSSARISTASCSRGMPPPNACSAIRRPR